MPRTRIRLVVVAAAAAGALVVVPAGSATAGAPADRAAGADRPTAQAAHSSVVSRTPAPGRAHRGVRRVAITLSQRLQTGKLDVLRGGRAVSPRRSGPSGSTVSATFGRALPRGAYEVRWRAVASDGHLQTGSWRFRVG